MPRLKHILIDKSRNREFLIKAALVIGVLGILGGFVANRISPPSDLAHTAASQQPELEDLWKLTEQLNDLSSGAKPKGISAIEAAEWIRRDQFGSFAIISFHLQQTDPAQMELLENYAAALSGEAALYAEARAGLQRAAAERPPQRLANELYADVLRLAGEHTEAARYFRAEIESFPESAYAREGEIDSLIESDRLEQVALLFDDPAYRAFLGDRSKVKTLKRLKRWWALGLNWGQRMVQRQTFAMVGLTALCGAMWFTIITLFGRGWSHRGDLVLYGLAVIAGGISTVATIAVSTWQTETFGFDFNGNFANDLIYCISGIGLREEVLKLLLFIPFLPFLLKSRSSMKALATGACVGLGFAIVENLSYFGSGLEGMIFLRLITANFLHISLTGVLGLALFHLCRWPKSRWEEFIATFIIVVVAHGVYDALAGLVQQLSAQFSILTIIVFAVIAIRYISVAREVREGGPSSVSPLGVFVIGSALIVALAWIHACYFLPTSTVMTAVGKPALSMGTLAFLFVSQLRGE